MFIFCESSACTTLSKNLSHRYSECMNTGFGGKHPWTLADIHLIPPSVYQNINGNKKSPCATE